MNGTVEHVDARYFGEHPDFFSGEYVTVQISDDGWFAFNEYGEGIEIEPMDVYILED